MTQHLSWLRPTEPVRLDHGWLLQIYERMGREPADAMVCRAMEALALNLARADHASGKGKWNEVRKNARDMRKIAQEIGLPLVARVSGDVMRTLDQQDYVAVGATLGRLMRAGEHSLAAIWDVADGHHV